MKVLLKLSLVAFLFLCFTTSCDRDQSYYYHVLLLDYSNEAPLDTITQDVLKFKEIPSVLDIKFGKIQPEERNKIHTFSYSLLLKFKNKQGFLNYLEHPYHKKIYKKHKPFIVNIYRSDFASVSLKE
jgi:hypothetical protein